MNEQMKRHLREGNGIPGAARGGKNGRENEESESNYSSLFLSSRISQPMEASSCVYSQPNTVQNLLPNMKSGGP